MRAFNVAWGVHFYTTGAQDMNNALAQGYISQPSPGLIYNVQVPNSVPYLRALSDAWHDHFYTIFQTEFDFAIANLGYHQENTAGFLYPSPQCGAIPLFRLINDQVHDHFYTENPQERDGAAAAGYRYEGIAGFILPN
ncbi:hypothetical protein P691DRAFT_271962 [Macrolepiota fuliginosa MF-IS2]|uniref:DUF5648 domain-containing protein n=1 Tax=Macrolepiota fuliginosa MF-IS2 TaxID=1400762 RepID=A0A9P5X9T2_9AGAR|nr:hypothetical protein P691DRAFT_271962 [Macrolepiota fuliginosa MF-IS2]